MKNILLLLLVTFPLFFFAQHPLLRRAPKTILSELRADHPRLILTNDRLNALKILSKSDTLLQRYVDNVITTANSYLEAPVLEHKLIGPRLLHVSRACRARIYALGLAYRWTGDSRYAEAAKQNLLQVVSFQDWNISHFLDVAEMAHAVGVGLDWLYAYLKADERLTIKKGLIKHALEPGKNGLSGEDLGYNGWPKDEHNWNQVCNGGLIIGALAIGESDPEYADFIVSKAVASLPYALLNYGPDGAWMEGPAYWNYATMYTAYGLEAMRTALGTDFGLSEIEGMAETGDFMMYCEGPTGYMFNFADSAERNSMGSSPCMLWLANRYGNESYANHEHAVLKSIPATPEHVIWYYPPNALRKPKELVKYFDGDVEVMMFRSEWDNPNALFLAIKAGYNAVNHGHLDLGNFELDALGERWVRDLGSDYYNLPGYFDKRKRGERWQYFRMLSDSHNVPMLGDQSQDVLGNAKFIKVATASETPYGIIDLSTAYPTEAWQVKRGVLMLKGHRGILIQDEIKPKHPTRLKWGITTDAQINISESGTLAMLEIKGKKLEVRLLSPGHARFTQQSAVQSPPQKRNEGVSRLEITWDEINTETTISILFAPVWMDDTQVSTPLVKPLQEW
ncbi:heparinase II/III domain-containing protein [Aestuariivivens sediminis]|uniref:heparinase II/III domain-containing protein n=1 Tax=Aestuariivivens sediminis TaxID=2913557 RepID=UPI001F55D86B|nr:heparinase II/III family protein [Aestuariivivens sediminis]